MSNGGKRFGSGRKPSTFGEPSFLVRMPISVQSKVVGFLEELKK